MIGNDVVDLLQSRQESNWQRTGFLEKLFTADEQQAIKQDIHPEIMVWLFWSMKEAAYKIYNRQTKLRAYIPKKLICKILSNTNNYITGMVTCDENVYYTKSTILNDSIHTVAVSSFDDLNNVIEIKKIRIFKDQYGIPYLRNLGAKIQDVSISHHGRFEKVVTII
ncbi:phosphopantetheinyl transferase [Flavobacterium cheongpyeongense]|uniref:Phosphopantetheinyl transferase n=1 Tax=Flavobacterium cheongpyeongense TaxID=2212651 RepID=A0A2V4BSV0_9FLAO|nr:4'-phosphopantetheinyl transferase superfamily protein [Flavobacterium cheongpyeongense]PXY42095.1 phosphopantetheinyl transferase [Flavobacterium cheongpyeongense]